MNIRKIQMPRDVYIGPDIIGDTPDILKALKIENKVLVVTGHSTYKIGAIPAIQSLESKNYDVELIKVDKASIETVNEVEEIITPDTTVLGIGGGKVIDVAKLSSFNANVNFVSMPTTASHDGIVSPLASIKNSNTSTSLETNSPIALICDSNIIANSPFKLLAAGCADLISNFTAIKDWELAHRLKNEEYSESAASLSIMSAKMITNNMDNIKPGLEESARLVMKTLFSSGMAISIAGSSRPASGSEHMFSHSLDKILDKPRLHGEQCGVGTILMMALYGDDWKFIRDSLNAVGAPTTAKGLKISDEDVIDALTMAHTIRPERYTILGDNGISRDAAWELAYNTEVI